MEFWFYFLHALFCREAAVFFRLVSVKMFDTKIPGNQYQTAQFLFKVCGFSRKPYLLRYILFFKINFSHFSAVFEVKFLYSFPSLRGENFPSAAKANVTRKMKERTNELERQRATSLMRLQKLASIHGLGKNVDRHRRRCV